MTLKSCWSCMRRFAKAQARCATSCVLNALIFEMALAEIVDIRWTSLICRLAQDQAVIARGAGWNSPVFLRTSVVIAAIRSSLRVAHCAIAQEMCERLCAVKVLIFDKDSSAMALTSCSFQRPHFANAQAAFESWRWSNSDILLTISAAITDISASLRTPREAKPQTIPAMSWGENLSAWYCVISAILFNSSTTMGSVSCSLPSVKARFDRSRGQRLESLERS
mmetsp:Transcript_39233/g.117217  ORF Transcript_39233/g.117217 Transcript_39233/m.117217 type:complete len:223 (+) Transcript_39233:1520-2188(+)